MHKLLIPLGIGAIALGAYFFRNQIKNVFTNEVSNIESILFSTGSNLPSYEQANRQVGASGGQVLSDGTQVF